MYGIGSCQIWDQWDVQGETGRTDGSRPLALVSIFELLTVIGQILESQKPITFTLCYMERKRHAVACPWLFLVLILILILDVDTILRDILFKREKSQVYINLPMEDARASPCFSSSKAWWVRSSHFGFSVFDWTIWCRAWRHPTRRVGVMHVVTCIGLCMIPLRRCSLWRAWMWGPTWILGWGPLGLVSFQAATCRPSSRC